MSIIDKMQEFNTLIDRNNKAEIFFNNDDVPVNKKHEAFDDYNVLLKRLMQLHSEITGLGYTFNENDFKYGIGRGASD